MVQAHPRLSQLGTDRRIPIGLHGDAGAMSKQEGLMVLTWNSLLGEGVAADTRFIINLIRKSQLLPENATLEAIYQIAAWSLNSMQSGMWPSRDAFGSILSRGSGSLANGWRASCIQVRGDWQFYAQAFNFGHWRSDCGVC